MLRLTSENSLKKNILTLLITLAIIASVISLGFYGVKNIKYSQYRERVENSNILMEKICLNIQTAIDFNWQSVHHAVDLLEKESFSSVPEMMEYVRFCEESIKETSSTKLLLISKDGTCYVTDGTTFKWMSPSLLNETEDAMYVSDYQFASKTVMQMHYLSRFNKPFMVEGVTFTHVSLACDMNELDSFFNIRNYGEESITFIIHRNGSQVYREEKQNALSGIYNLLSTIQKGKFGYGESYEAFEKDISSGVNDSVYLTLDGIDYFVSYHHLEIMDWVFVLLAPAEYVDSSTKDFTKDIILSVILLCGIFLAVLLCIFGISAHQINKKQKIVNEQLVKVAEAERSANEAKTNFLSSMSHDIRTPMNAITGMVTIASKRVNDTEYIKECLGKIGLASDHLLTLINNILDISKVESGKMMLNPENFSLTDSFTNLINIMQPQVKEKKQEFCIRVHNVQNEYLYGDKLRLNQIFINILSNAIKYTQKEGSIWVDLYEEQLNTPDHMVRIKYVVKDNGMGMSKEFQKTMYQSFSRASDSRTNKTQGSGLGLAICKQMVDLMGGTITCDSELGVGTTFTVTVDMPIAGTETEELCLPKIEVLLLDDDEVFLETASDTLESLGLTVTATTDSKTAIEKVESRHTMGEDFPFIIVDKKLPGMDGIEVVRQIRNIVKAEIPIIVVSAYDTSTFEEEARIAGANGAISKPFFKSKVYECISHLIGSGEASHYEHQNDYSSLAGTRILVAEDNDMNWEIAETILEMYGISSDRAENGQICIDMLNNAEKGDYSIVLMDVRMPVMDGREATRILRSSEKEWIRSMPIVAMTADAFAEDVQECIAAGMDDHISKPLDMERLLYILHKYCS